MTQALLGLAVLGGGAALALALLTVLRARAIKARHLRFAGEPLPRLDAAAERILEAPRGLLHGTRFADGQRLLSAAYAEPCVADIFCTGQAVFIRREQVGPEGGKTVAIPLAWIGDADLHRGHAALAGRELPMLRLRWRRGGEELATELSLRGGMAQLERLRREVHLRQGRGEMLAQLRKYVEAEAAAPPAESPPGRGEP
ncbi:MAG TPA: hypothetical protein VN874_10905 [Myxococcales bacterium]|jgi:hypothetical protein|nr:hypothetical protein [Myxococcales bacterium]